MVQKQMQRAEQLVIQVLNCHALAVTCPLLSRIRVPGVHI